MASLRTPVAVPADDGGPSARRRWLPWKCAAGLHLGRADAACEGTPGANRGGPKELADNRGYLQELGERSAIAEDRTVAEERYDEVWRYACRPH